MNFDFDNNANAATGAVVERRTDAEKVAHGIQMADTLRILIGSGWVTRSELLVVTHRFSACIYALRKIGHVILSEKNDFTKQLEWKYSHQVESCAVTDDWKAAYYDSPHWAARRAARKKHDGFRCANCHGIKDLQVHHWRYDLFAEKTGDLMTLCRACHGRMHSNVRVSFPATVPKDVFDRLAH
jgi:hypothetical protein